MSNLHESFKMVIGCCQVVMLLFPLNNIFNMLSALYLFFFYWHNVHKQSISFFILFHTYIRHSNNLYSTICGNKNKRNNLYLSFLLSNSFKIYLTKIRVVFSCCFLFWLFGMNIVCFYYTQILKYEQSFSFFDYWVKR